MSPRNHPSVLESGDSDDDGNIVRVFGGSNSNDDENDDDDHNPLLLLTDDSENHKKYLKPTGMSYLSSSQSMTARYRRRCIVATVLIVIVATLFLFREQLAPDAPKEGGDDEMADMETIPQQDVQHNQSLEQKQQQQEDDVSLLRGSIREKDDIGEESTAVQQVDVCSNLATTLPKLVDELKTYPEERGLQPIDIRISEDEEHVEFATFPGLVQNGNNSVSETSLLIERAFYGKKIVLLGDSTLRFLTGWLQVLLDDTCGNKSIRESTAEISSNTTSMSNANAWMKRKATSCTPKQMDLYSTETPIAHIHPIHDEINTHIQWFGFGGLPSGQEMVQLLEDAWLGASNVGPEILVVNMGMHWLHFINHGRTLDVQDAYKWIHYETVWLQDAIDRAYAMGTVKTLLFKTTNAICTDKFHGGFLKGHKAYTIHDDGPNNEAAVQATIESCVETMSRKFEESQNNDDSMSETTTQEQIYEYCQYGTFNDNGSQYLNQRLHKFVANYEHHSDKSRSRRASKIKIGILNDHDVETCEYTGDADGRHYHQLNLLRIRLLGNLIDCAERTVDAIDDQSSTDFEQQMKQYAAANVA